MVEAPKQAGGFIPNFITNGFGFNPIVGVFTRPIIHNNFCGIQKLYKTQNALFVKLLLLLPILFETRDIFIAGIILLFILIVNELLNRFYEEEPQQTSDN
jgi:hypothetical protein